MEFNIGMTLGGGRYRIEGLLGSGSYGNVYLVRHVVLNVCRAAKIIDRQTLFHIAIREADILKSLRHPAIPIIYDVEQTDSYVMIIEEYVQGESLQSFIFPNLTISYRDVIRTALQLVDVVEYLHRHGIYHQDIKPGNILLDHGQLRLLDYGSAITSTEEQANRPHMGTKGYAAPEQYGIRAVGSESDIYSIGVVLLVMATGKRTQAALDEVQPEALRRVIRRCMSHSQQERYSSVGKLREDLLRLEIEKRDRLDKRDRKQNVPESLTIHMAGIMNHCGTTHCAVAAAQALRKEGYHPVLREHNDSGDFRELIRASNRIAFHGGIFTADGLDYIPEYHGGAEPAGLARYNRILWDDGVACEANAEHLMSGDIICLVSGTSPPELTKLSRFLRSGLLPVNEEPERFRILLNFADARHFKRAVRDYNLPNPIRVPYQVLF